MENSLTEVRDAFYCGFLEKAQSTLDEIQQNPNFAKSDSLYVQDVQLLQLQCTLEGLTSYEDVEGLCANASMAHKIVCQAAICMSTKTTPLEKLTAFTFLKNEQSNAQLDPSSKALLTFALAVLSPSGEAVADSSELGSINSAISAILATGSTETPVYEIILFLLADRPDLALKVHSRVLMSNDDSVLPQLMQSWMAMAKGNYQEAFLSVQDIEAIIGTDSDKTSWRMDALRGLARLHAKQFEEAVEYLKTAAEASKYKEPSVLINLIAAQQNMGKQEDANETTDKLRQVLQQAHPYWNALDELKTVAAKFDTPSSVAAA